ncbi:MAG: choice-of-anchor P family protein [Actinomycetota bacterium]
MHSRKLIARLVAVLLVALVGATFAPLPVLAAPIVFIDEGGANDNDGPGQKDLTRHTVDTAGLPNTIAVTWNWDIVTISGNNTADGCALFDTDGDGLANSALCVTWGGSTPTQIAGSPRLFTCNDTRADRCAGAVQVPGTPESTCSVAVTNTDPFGPNVPNGPGTAFPNDTTASCTIVLAEMGAGAELLNTCSYPSAQPNSDPSDCVLIPRDAFIKIVKVATPAEDGTDFNFNLTPPGGLFATIDGSGETAFLPVRSDVPVTLTEVVPTGWTLASISCTGGGPVVSKPSVTVDLASGQQITCTFTNNKLNPSLTINKEGTLATGSDGATPGDVISYTFLVTNTGDVALTGVTVTDPLPGLSAISCPATTLAVGASMTCTATYAITQADINTGSVTNTATADSTESGPDSDTNVEPIPQAPAIDIDKEGTVALGSDGATPGDVISYTFVVTNVGNVTLTGVTVTDPKVGLSAISCPGTSLAPAASMTCTATYAITQADIDAGSVTNTATADSTQSGPDSDTNVEPLPQAPAIDIDKEGSLNEGGNGATPGDVISYTFVVTNVGNVTLTGITVTDPLSGLSAISCPGTSLAPGASMTCTATYAITQADINAGSVTNTATADSNQSGPDSDTNVEPITQTAAINLDKEGTLALGGNGSANPGDVISYTFVVTNTGNVTLTGITVTDPKVGLSAISCPATALAPGASMTCTATYTITQSDIDAGSVTNTGTADSTQSEPDSDTNIEPIPQAPAIDTQKSGVLDDGSDNVVNPGDKINYTITVTNIGNTTLTGVTVVDPLAGVLVCTWPGATGTLGVGQAVSCTGSYTITQADIDAGNVHNIATGDSDQTPPDDDEFDVPITQTPAMSVVKSSVNADENGNGLLDEGDTLTYVFTVTNTGNTTLTGVTVSDAVPAQTTYVSCTGGCETDGPPVTQVSWAIAAPIAPQAAVAVSMTVSINAALSSCQICNTAMGDSAQTAPTPSNQLCLIVTPGAHPELAHASGNAYAANVGVDILGIDETLIPVDSVQSGVGADSDADSLLSVSLLPPTGNVLRAGLLQTTSSSVVSEEPARASDTGTAEVLGVNILNGVVTADVVRAVASATADGSSSTTSSLGSTFKNLKVRGVAMNNVAPNTTVRLPAALFGAGSYVRLYEQLVSTARPAPGQLSGGTYAADIAVNMIRVHVTNMALLGRVEIVVSHAFAHADFPQITLCGGGGLLRAVSGHAFIAHAAINPDLLSATVGFVGIPPSGGSDHQALDEADILDGSVVDAAAADSDSTGFIAPAGAWSSSYAEAADVCVLRTDDGCTVGATLVRSQANSTAGGGMAFSNPTGTQLVGLVIAGTPINVTPPPNTVIELPGIGFVILNEQLCDGTAALPSCSGTTSSGLTVRSIRVVITAAEALIEGLGIEIIVAEAHADSFAAV